MGLNDPPLQRLSMGPRSVDNFGALRLVQNRPWHSQPNMADIILHRKDVIVFSPYHSHDIFLSPKFFAALLDKGFPRGKSRSYCVVEFGFVFWGCQRRSKFVALSFLHIQIHPILFRPEKCPADSTSVVTTAVQLTKPAFGRLNDPSGAWDGISSLMESVAPRAPTSFFRARLSPVSTVSAR